MIFGLARELQDELQAIDVIFQKSLWPWWDSLAVYLGDISDDFTYRLLPAVAYSSYLKVGVDKDLSRAMVNIFKTIYFANQIHVRVKDDSEGQKHNQDLQYTILIGDYIFGRILKLLLESGADKLLPVFAQLICEMNESLVIEYKLQGDITQILARGRAGLYSAAFITAGKLAGLNDKLLTIYGEIGRNLGMALELKYRYGEDFHSYMYTAQKLLYDFNTVANRPEGFIDNLINELIAEDLSFTEIVAVG